MSDHRNVRVYLCGPGGTALSVWDGPVPSNGDKVTYDRGGPGCTEPERMSGIITGRNWSVRDTYHGENETQSHSVRECWVIVDWKED